MRLANQSAMMTKYSPKKFFYKKSVFDVYRPFFLMSKIFGMGTFKFHNEKFQNCWIGIFGFAINLLFIVWLFFVQDQSIFSFSKVLSFGMIFVKYLPLVAALLFVVLSAWKRKKFHKVLTKLDDLDKKVKRIYPRTRNFYIMLVCRSKRLSTYRIRNILYCYLVL